MAVKTDTEVIIGGKVFTLSGYESEEYLQKVASYINNKMSEYSKLDSFRRQPVDRQNVLLQLNIADDYFKARKQIALFLKLYEEGKKEVEKLYALGDLKRLAIRIHALKANAKGLGAIDLFYTARRMEARCQQNDAEYLSTTIGHLLMEWKRAREGFLLFERKLREQELLEQEQVGAYGLENPEWEMQQNDDINCDRGDVLNDK